MIFIKKNYILLILFLAFVNYTDAQDLKTAIRTKTDPLLALKLQEKIPTGKTSFSFYVRNTDSARLLLQSLKSGTIRMDDRLPIVTTELSWEHITKLIQSNQILFISEQQIPKEELLFGATDYSCNNIRLMQSAFPEYNGNNTLVSVKENRPDTLDIDLKGRYLNNQFVSNTFSSHASVMSTIIAGAGNTWHGSLGVAPGAKLNSVSFMNLLPEPSSFYGQGPTHIQNHSYGTINQNFYGIEAAAYDASTFELPSLLHVISAGNEGTVTTNTGRYEGIAGYSNMTGNFKQAKNILTVGHTDSSYRVLPASSAGPAFDGRVKPELVAYGEDGSSGAAAIVSGIGLLLQNAYQLQNNGSVAPASLIKACLINGAKDVDAAGIDFRSGYGSADAYASLMSLQQKQYFTGAISSNETKRFSIDVPQGIKELKVTLCWTDPSALPSGMNKALINDLDLEIQHSSSSQIWLPWVLNAFPHKDSLQLPAVRKRDTLNTNEQISIKAPVAGTYEIVIIGSKIQTGNQDYSVAYSFDSSNVFQWEYPTKNDVVLP